MSLNDLCPVLHKHLQLQGYQSSVSNWVLEDVEWDKFIEAYDYSEASSQRFWIKIQTYQQRIIMLFLELIQKVCDIKNPNFTSAPSYHTFLNFKKTASYTFNCHSPKNLQLPNEKSDKSKYYWCRHYQLRLTGYRITLLSKF